MPRNKYNGELDNIFSSENDYERVEHTFYELNLNVLFSYIEILNYAHT